MIAELEAPRTIWVMVPAGEVVESVLKDVYPLLDEGDIVIEGGNSFYKDTLRVLKKRKLWVTLCRYRYIWRCRRS